MPRGCSAGAWYAMAFLPSSTSRRRHLLHVRLLHYGRHPEYEVPKREAASILYCRTTRGAALLPVKSKLPSSTAVFLGPSLPGSEAKEILAADYYPPARRGDVYRIVASGIKTIVLIDGVFHSAPSIWPREILDAIAEGIQVLGASSMGALRAAELHEFGMLGYGTIFDWCRKGLIGGDDEVALWHGA